MTGEWHWCQYPPWCFVILEHCTICTKQVASSFLKEQSQSLLMFMLLTVQYSCNLTAHASSPVSCKTPEVPRLSFTEFFAFHSALFSIPYSFLNKNSCLLTIIPCVRGRLASTKDLRCLGITRDKVLAGNSNVGTCMIAGRLLRIS